MCRSCRRGAWTSDRSRSEAINAASSARIRRECDHGRPRTATELIGENRWVWKVGSEPLRVGDLAPVGVLDLSARTATCRCVKVGENRCVSVCEGRELRSLLTMMRPKRRIVMRRDCAMARRIARLKQFGRLADEVLSPEAADIVLGLVGDELLRLGIHPLLVVSVDPETTIH